MNFIICILYLNKPDLAQNKKAKVGKDFKTKIGWLISTELTNILKPLTFITPMHNNLV